MNTMRDYRVHNGSGTVSCFVRAVNKREAIEKAAITDAGCKRCFTLDAPWAILKAYEMQPETNSVWDEFLGERVLNY